MDLRSVTAAPSSDTTAEPWWWLGLTPSERDAGEPAAPPPWVGFTDAVLASAPADPPPYTGDTDGLGGFIGVIAPFAARAGDGLAPVARADVDVVAGRAVLVARLGRRLAGLSARTLVLELNVMRVTGRLDGADSAARFRDFVRQTSSRAALTVLLAEYPVLARLVAQECLDATAAAAELLDRFAADRAAIVRELLGGTDPGPLRAVETGAGDRHEGGRSVAILRFDAARVVYKPRPLAIHRSFNEIVAWFNARWRSDSLRTVDLLERDGYGWVGHVESAPCEDAAGLERFYRRQGAHLALLYPLQSTDIHFENVIACGDQPVLIDVETLFHPVTAPQPAAGSDPAAVALDSSVFRTSLLPRFMLGDDTALDVSGLGGDDGATLPTESATWDGGGTDLMRLVRRPGTLTGAGNRPTLAGAHADPAAFVEAFINGFTSGYAVITGAREELTGPGGLFHRCAAQATRVVLRPTRVYAALLDESTHPHLMGDAAERDRVLRTLHDRSTGDDLLRRVVDDEIAQLWAGDVPLFTARPGAPDLWHGSRRTGAVLAATGLAAAVRRVAAMDEVDLGDQVWIIRAAMASRSATPAHDMPAARAVRATATAPDPERVLAAARRIGDQMVAMAFRGDDRVNWLGLELIGDRFWNVAPLGAALGNGYCGTALFLAHLAEITGTARYAEVARLAVRPLPAMLGVLAENPRNPGIVGSGAFAGLGGITHALTVLAPLLDDAAVTASLDLAARLTVTATASETELGAGGGCAGGLVALLAAHPATGAGPAWTAAAACADRLMAAPALATPGFYHGTAGIGWALLRFAEAGGGPAYEAAGLAALRAAAHAATGPTGWPSSALSWCRGRPGVALAIADCPAARADPALAGMLAATADAVTAHGPLTDHSLCHGELGALELLGRTGGVPVDRAGGLLAALDRGDTRCATPSAVASPGLLTGLAGIGHGLLRLGFAGQVPPVLPPRPRTNTATSHPTMSKGTP